MPFKKRTGFGKIVMSDLKTYQFNWTAALDLILYSEGGEKTVISCKDVWSKVPDSKEYEAGLPTWHGKHKSGPEWAGYGKREARELYRKHSILTERASLLKGFLYSGGRVDKEWGAESLQQMKDALSGKTK